MIAVLIDACRGTLTPTASYDRREWAWVPGSPYDVDGRDGELTIHLVTTGKRRVRTLVSVYAVQVEWEYAAAYGVASFLLESVLDPDAEGPFRCTLGLREECGCECGNFDRRRVDVVGCKHRDALRDLLTKGDQRCRTPRSNGPTTRSTRGAGVRR